MVTYGESIFDSGKWKRVIVVFVKGTLVRLNLVLYFNVFKIMLAGLYVAHVGGCDWSEIIRADELL